METQYRNLSFEEENSGKGVTTVAEVLTSIAKVLTGKSLFFLYLIGSGLLFAYASYNPEPLRLYIAGAYTVLNIPLLWLVRKW